MAQAKHSAPASRTRWSNSAIVAAALVAAASLGGCAGSSGFAGATAPYQVAGPVVDHPSAQPSNQDCGVSLPGFADTCSAFPHYDGP